ncbi:hypothetical protein L208DRAFT_1277858, partial [Tricholoma matsutake]
LLPCGKLHGGVRKFTGSDDIGEALDDITKAVHAFTHFSLLYSSHHMLFCDLQGKVAIAFWDRTYTLFNPQAHTSVIISKED